MSGTNSTTERRADHFVAVYTIQILLLLVLCVVCCFAAKLKRKSSADYHNIEFVDIEAAPMVSYNEFRPQSQSDNIESDQRDDDGDDSVQQQVESKPGATKVDSKPGATKVDSDLE